MRDSRRVGSDNNCCIWISFLQSNWERWCEFSLFIVQMGDLLQVQVLIRRNKPVADF